MLCVSGEFQIDPKDVEAARAAAIDMMTETAKEDGCIHYRFYQDVEPPDRFHVYEEWESEAHLAAHAASDHMQVFRAALGQLNIISRNVKKFDAGPATSI